MRLAFISLMGGLPWGGSEVLWSKTAKYALNCGYEVMVSVYDWGKLPKQVEELKPLGASVFLRERYNPKANFLKKLIAAVKARIPELNKEYSTIIDFKPDAVLISQGDSFDLAIHHRNLYELLQKNCIPYYLICHSHSQFGDIPDKNVYPGAVDIFIEARKVFFVSNRMQQLTERKLCLKLSNAFQTWNPLNLSQFDYLKYPTQGTINFAIVGSLGESKGHDTLFEVLSGESWKARNWQLNIYGDGYGADYLDNLSTFFSIKHKITFKGFAQDALEIWRDNSILLIPSAGEGMPISLIEAMICGRPAVVTDVGGNTEIIEEGLTGFIAEAPSVNSFNKALERAWEQRDDWQQMGEKARTFALENIDLQPEITLFKRIVKL